MRRTEVLRHTSCIRLVTMHGEPVRDIDVPGERYLQALDWSPDGLGFFTTLNNSQESSLAYVPLNGALRVAQGRQGLRGELVGPLARREEARDLRRHAGQRRLDPQRVL